MNTPKVPPLSNSISNQILLSILGDEVGDPYNNECPLSIAKSQLHCGAWINDEPQITSLRSYVKTGMSSLECISVCAEDKIENIQLEIDELECMEDKEDRIRFLREVIDWMEAISYRADNVNEVEMVLAIVEEWADYNGIDLEPEEED
jgi:hypothetical protein